jgi:hypothetical protein
MPKWLNIDVGMARNACCSRFISERLILKQGIDTLSGALGFVVIVVMGMDTHINKLGLKLETYVNF